MKDEQVHEVVRFLERKGIDTLVVGGVVMQKHEFATTMDVDTLTTVEGFGSVTEVLARDPEVTGFMVQGGVATGFLLTHGERIRFDILDPAFFSGKRNGDEFFRYVKQHWSEATPNGRFALPALVWYTRLFVQRETYLERIADELEEGAPVEWLDQALEIARYLGTERRILDRLRRLHDVRPIGRSAEPKHLLRE
jgi:hypothetical protein